MYDNSDATKPSSPGIAKVIIGHKKHINPPNINASTILTTIVRTPSKVNFIIISIYLIVIYS